MKIKKIILAVLILFTIYFSSCGSIVKNIIGEHGYNSAAYPGNRVALGTANYSGTEDNSNWYFDREETGQYYFEYHYYVKAGSSLTGNFGENIMLNINSSVNINSIILNINNGSIITLLGRSVQSRTNTFRFQVSSDVIEQLKNCKSFTLQAIGQGIHESHQVPFEVWERGLGIVEIKRFINYWNEGGSTVNVASVNSDVQRENQTNINQVRESNTQDTRIQYDSDKKLRYPLHPPNCCHNIFGR
jgi:hypothetical protein